MSPTEQRIAIAELCGITVEDCTCAPGLIKRDAKTKRHLPDYLVSLDACALFEATLTDRNDHTKYALQVRWEVMEAGRVGDYQLITASPAIRCRAFLELKGKWQSAPAEGGEGR